MTNTTSTCTTHEIPGGSALRAAAATGQAAIPHGTGRDLTLDKAISASSHKRRVRHYAAPAPCKCATMSFNLVTRLHLDGIRWRRSAATASSRDGPARSGRGFGAERNPARVVFFSDAVFAITVTLLVLEIKPPTDYTNLLHGLAALWPSYLAYALTFLFVGQVWANHHVMFDHIRAADRAILLLNTLLLMIVAFLPFATSVLAGALRSGHGLRTATIFYGIAFDVTALTFNAVWQYARRHRLLSEALDTAGATAIGRQFQLALAWLAIGALLGLLIPFLGVAMIAAFNVFYWLPIRGESPRPRD